MQFYRALKARNLVHSISKEIRPTGFYLGVDPTAPSLHLGHLVGLMALFQAYRECKVPSKLLVGSYTAMIGDPSWRTSDRLSLDKSVCLANTSGISKFLESLLSRNALSIDLVYNRDWLETMTLTDYLNTVGQTMRMGDMLSKDFVKSKLNSQTGLSFLEFNYSLLQAHTFFATFTKLTESICKIWRIRSMGKYGCWIRSHSEKTPRTRGCGFNNSFTIKFRWKENR